MNYLVAAAEEVHRHVELPMSTWMYGVIALIVFIILGVATWSYRDVANRHSHKTIDHVSGDHTHGGH